MKNNLVRNLLLLSFICTCPQVKAQIDGNVSAGFFDSSESTGFNYATFHLPPLSILFENAKANPQILDLAKAQEIAQAEVAKQKRHIFSYVRGHASYSYGKTDMWGNNSSTYNQMIYQFQGNVQSYWNVGVNSSVPLEDILDLSPAVTRKKLEVDQAQIKKDIAYDQLKLQIATLYVKITNNLVSLKTASENAAIYQGAGTLNQEEFHNGNISIKELAQTKNQEQNAVALYQQLQTQIATDVITLEILTHTPIITNSTTDITLDSDMKKSAKQIAKENKAVEKRIKEAAEEEERLIRQLEKEEKKKQKKQSKE